MSTTQFRIETKKFPIMANGKFENGNVSYANKFTKVGERKVIFVHSKIDDALLFESTSRELVVKFCNTTTLR